MKRSDHFILLSQVTLEMELRPWNEVVDFYRRTAARGLRFLAVAWHVRKCIRSALNCGVSIKTITGIGSSRSKENVKLKAKKLVEC